MQPERIRLIDRTIVWDGFIRLELLKLEQRMPNGETVLLDREVHDHGNAAAILLYDTTRGTVVLVRQFRTAAYVNGDPAFMIEVAAGLLDGDAPDDAIRREASEETGYAVSSVRFLFDMYGSPGTLTEKVSLFVAEIDTEKRAGAGGGLAEEGEDIEVMEIPFDEAFAMIASGGITDAKTIILLQWAAMNVDAFRR